MKNNLLTLSNNISNTDYFLRLVHSNKLHNSIILSGAKGIGKKTWGYNCAKFLLSHKIQDLSKFSALTIDDSISNLMEKKSHSNYLEIMPAWDSTKNQFKELITVDEIRKIKDFLNLTKNNDYYKVIVINALDNLNNNGANALLKTLEEPNSDTIFFLICHNYQNILDTIKSRCINIHFNNLSNNDILKLIEFHNIEIKDDYKDGIIKLSSGSFEKLRWYLEEKNLNLYKMIINFIRADNNNDITKILNLIKSSATADSKIIFEILENYLLNHFTDENINEYAETLTYLNKLKQDTVSLNLDTNTVFLSIITKIKKLLSK